MRTPEMEVCSKCGKQFSWAVSGDVWPGGKDREDIICPYCGECTGSVVTSGFLVTKKAEDEQ